MHVEIFATAAAGPGGHSGLLPATGRGAAVRRASPPGRASAQGTRGPREAAPYVTRREPSRRRSLRLRLDRDKRGVWVYYRARTEALASLGTLIGSPAR